MGGFYLKDAGSDLTCAVDWRAGGLAAAEHAIDDLGWQVRPVDGDADLRIRAQSVRADRSDLVVGGGVPGRTYLLCGTVGTDRGRQLRRSLVVRVEGRA